VSVATDPRTGRLLPARDEDQRLVTGQGRYTADWNLPGQLHAAVVRSDRAHARLLKVDGSAASEAPGVVAVLTAFDVAEAGFQPIPGGPPVTGADGKPQVKCQMPILATDRVRFVGQPVAMVIADTARAAQDAAELVAIDYDDLPAVATVDAALAADAPRLHDAMPGNVSVVYEAGDEAAVAAAFARATHVTRLRVESQRLAGVPLEPRACLAAYDAQRDRYTVYTPTQGMLGMRQSLTAITGYDASRIEVVAQDVGGSFGLRGGPFPEHALVMLAARRLGRPVKWVGSRSEVFLSDWHGRALVLDASVALDAEGNILALRYENQADLGAHTCYFQSMIGTRNLTVTMGGPYRVPALHARCTLVYTNTVPVSAYRGAGRPDIAYAIERLIDQAAAEHGFDRVALRRRNFIAPTAFPYTTANGTVYDSGEFAAVMDKALAMADYAGFEARRREAQARGRLRGIGFGCYLEASGGGVAPKDQVSARFRGDGLLHLYGVTGPSGQGHETSFTRIVADELGVPREHLRYHASDPGEELVGNGTGGSRSLYGAGSALKILARNLIMRALPHAARALALPEGTLEYRDGAFHAGEHRLGLLELADSLRGAAPHPLDCEGEFTSGTTFPNGCHVAEIEIDPATGTTEIVAYTAVDDLGHLVSPQLAQGQVHGGVVQGAGQVFGEQLVYDPDTAQLLAGSFMDYVMPRAGWLRNIRTDYHLVPTTLNALGAKGVGESGCSGSLPGLVNAMSDALRREGVPPMDMPFTPPRVWAALQARH
jgi:carbon-monoxide dehydrogenase large subunit